MRFARPLTRRAYTMLGTLLAIMGLLIGYFIFYLPNREEKLIEQKSRVLNQVARNFEAKWEVFKKNAEKIGDQDYHTAFQVPVVFIPTAIYEKKTTSWSLKSCQEIINSLPKNSVVHIRQNSESLDFANVSSSDILETLRDAGFSFQEKIEFTIREEKQLEEKKLILNLYAFRETLDSSIDDFIALLPKKIVGSTGLKLTYKNNYITEIEVKLNRHGQIAAHELKETLRESLNEYFDKHKESLIQQNLADKGNNSLLKFSFGDPKNNPFTFFHNAKEEKDTAEGFTIGKFYLSTQSSLFMEPLIDTKDFDGYFLYHTDFITGHNSQETSRIAFQSLPGELYAEQTFLATPTSKKDQAERIVSHILYNPNDNQGTLLNAHLSSTAYKLMETTFTTSNKDGSNTRWHLVGLTEREHFERERRSIPPILMVTYSLALLLVLFGLPQLKLLFMSRIEQLSTLNFVFTCLSAVLTASLLVTILLGLNAYSVHETNRVDRGLKAIADSLDEALLQETNAMFQAAKKYDENGWFGSPANLNKYNSFSLISQVPVDSSRKPIFSITDFDILFWINDQGEIVKEYSVTQTEDHHNSLILDKREYFQRILDQTAWKKAASPEVSAGDEYFIESIQSWDKGDKSCVLSIKSKQEGVAVLGIQKQLSSLFHTLLPLGYEFQVIDQSGLVLFHSSETRNLQENFLSESYGNPGITASMVSNTALFTDNEYKHHKYRTYIKPLNGAPWSLIVSYDRRYNSVPLSLMVAYTIISNGLIALVLSLLFIITTRVNRRPSRLSKSKLDISWLRPKEVNSALYSKGIRVNMAIIILLIVYNLFDEVISYQSFTIFLFSITLLYTTLFYKFRKNKEADLPVYLCLSVAAIILLVQWLLYEITLYEIIYLAFFMLILYYFVKKEEAVKETPKVETKRGWISVLLEGTSFRTAYTNLLFSFLIICAVLPSVFLFSKLYQEEKIIWKKYALFELNRKIIERDKAIQQKYHFLTQEEDKEVRERKTELISSWEGKGAYYRAAGYETGKCLNADCHTKDEGKIPFSLSYRSWLQDERSDHYLLSIFQEARPNIAGLVAETNGFLLQQGYNAKWSQVYREMVSANPQNSQRKNMMHLHIDNKPERNEVISIASPVPVLFQENMGINNMILGIVLLVFLYLLYLLISYIIKTYFSWHLFTLSEPFKSNKNHQNTGRNKPQIKNVFFVTSPYTSKLPLDGYEGVNLMLINAPKEFEKIQKKLKPAHKSPKILLQNFSYDPQSIDTWNKKLNLLEEFLATNDHREIAVQSHFRPLQIYEIYETRIRKMEDENKKAGNKEEVNSSPVLQELHETLSRWKDAFSSFYKVHVTPKAEKLPVSEPLKSVVAEQVSCILKREMAAWPDYFSWLPDYEERIKEEIGSNIQHKTGATEITEPDILNEIKEEVILKVQSMAQPFYFSLWNNCSMEDKYLLYDLAKDGIINPKARNQIYMLIEKGLVYQDENDQLHIRNKSFRNFILTNIKKSEAIEIEKQAAQTGTYNIMKAAVIIIAIASFGFMAFTNQGQLENLIAIFTGMAAVIPLFLRIGGWFSVTEGLKT